MRKRLAQMLIVMALLAPSRAAALPPDEELKAALVGTWMMDPGRTAPTDFAKQVFERFGPDGRGTVASFADSQCKIVRASLNFAWTVSDGFLVTTYPAGRIDYDRILSFDGHRLVIQPPHSGREISRVRAVACGRPAT